RGLDVLLALLLVIGAALGAHHHHREVLVVVDAGHDVVGPQHVLIEQIAEGEILGVIADRHRGDDLLRIEEDGERALDRDRGLDRRAGMVDAAHALGQPRIVWIGPEEIFALRFVDDRRHESGSGPARVAAKLAAPSMSPIYVGTTRASRNGWQLRRSGAPRGSRASRHPESLAEKDGAKPR